MGAGAGDGRGAGGGREGLGSGSGLASGSGSDQEQEQGLGWAKIPKLTTGNPGGIYVHGLWDLSTQAGFKYLPDNGGNPEAQNT